MKTIWAWLAKIFFVIAVIEAWFVYDYYRDNQQLQADNEALETRLLIAEQTVSDAQKQIEALEKRSIEGILRETNKAVVSGWETLLNKVQSELERAKDAIPDDITAEPESETAPKTEESQPSEESNSEELPNETETSKVEGHRT